jgi:VanZ family protein
MKKVLKIILYLVFFTCLIFLFVGGPDSHAPRSYLKFWDLGHLLLFFTGGILFLLDFRQYFKETFLRHLLVVFLFSLLLGLLTELLQVHFHQDPDLGDWTRDVIGGILAVVFFSPRRFDLPAAWLNICRIILIVLLVLEVYPFAHSSLDEWIAGRQFPVLADFETPFEVERWHHQQPLRLDKNIVRHGRKSLQVHLTTAKYSTVSFRYFPADWSNYSHFNFSLYNSGSDTLLLTLRINDLRHYTLGQEYHDRFNRVLRLAPGWSDWSIPLDEVVQAPLNRKMDIQHIDLICFFSMNLARPRIINIDNVYLSI